MALCSPGRTGSREKSAVVQLQPPETLRMTNGFCEVFVPIKVWLTTPPSSAIVAKSWRGEAKVSALLWAVARPKNSRVAPNNNIGKSRFTAQSYIFFNFFHKIFGG